LLLRGQTFVCLGGEMKIKASLPAAAIAAA
jgi:hypothetical protein